MSQELGPATDIGPECFASADQSVICWQGVNYYREPDDDELARVFVAMDGVTTEVPAACLNCSGEGWYIPGDSDDNMTCEECNGTGQLARCTCGHPGLTYDGPAEDCPTHGRAGKS